jgi:hypothetical protein
MIVKQIGVLSLGKVMGIMYCGLGLIFGAIFALISLLGAAVGAGTSGAPEAWFGVFFGIGAVILLPLMYGFIGFVGGLICAGIYNLAARFVGGLEIEVA